MTRLLALLLTLAAASASAQAPPAPSKFRRFAFLAGANDGGAGRARLRYATTDARAVSRVLTEIGGVRAGDLVFADEPDRAEFLRQLERMRQTIIAARNPEVRNELIFYYSGHSDEEGLLLRGERLPYPELRARIEEIPADVRVAVLDSCASGALTRQKGGVFRPPFMNDESVKLKGNAFLTSSAANEVAQESDRIAASFFTHFLVSGLRGAADVNRDRKVTFFEAYQFAAQETLARTERTRGGAQHAAYDISLNGTGDLVMTDVRSGSAGLVLQADLQGFISVREADDRLVAELRKAPGHPIELGLEPGKYVVTMAGGNQVFVASVNLREGERAEVSKLQFHPEPLELARARGDDPSATMVIAPSLAPVRVVPFSLGIIPDLSSAGVGSHERLRKEFSVNLIADRAAQVRGMQLSIGINWADEEMRGLQAAVAASISGGPVSGLQTAVGASVAGGDVTGLQTAVGLSTTQRNMRGLQAAVGAAHTGGGLRGVQLASGASWISGNGVGLQGAAAMSWTSGNFTGLQTAGGFNGVAGTISGAQIGVANFAGDVQGTQLGVVNVARVSHGLQLGVINYMEEDQGVPIGLFSYARKNGILRLNVFGTETSAANVGLKIGGRNVYNIIALGTRPGGGDNRFTSSLGLGVRAHIERRWLTFLDTEAVASSFNRTVVGDNNRLLLLSSLRLVGTWRLAQRFAVQAGPTVNVLVRKRGYDDVGPGGVGTVLHDGETSVSLYPGLLVGVEI
jgi:hypothetical protein